MWVNDITLKSQNSHVIRSTPNMLSHTEDTSNIYNNSKKSLNNLKLIILRFLNSKIMLIKCLMMLGSNILSDIKQQFPAVTNANDCSRLLIDSLKDQINSLQNEIQFLREELKVKNYLLELTITSNKIDSSQQVGHYTENICDGKRCCSININGNLYKSSPRTKHNWHCTAGFFINTAPRNVYFILHYHLRFFFECLYFSEYNIWMFVFVFSLKNRPSISMYVTRGMERGHSKCLQMCTEGEGYHVSCVRTQLHYLFSYFCLMMSCFICRNLTLPSFKKCVFVKNGYFSPMRSIYWTSTEVLRNLVAPLDSAVPSLDFEQINVFWTSGFDSVSIIFYSLSVSRSIPEFYFSHSI